MSESKHTPEPWRVEPGTTLVWGKCDPDDMSTYGMGYPVCDAIGPILWRKGPDIDEREANARRIVACVNACAGITTEALEAGVVGEMVELLKKFSAEADQWADTVSDDYRSPCIEPGAKAAHPGSETVFTIGDLRDASALIAKLGGAS